MLDAILSWIAANQSWAYLIVGIIAFGESLAIVGLIVPGAFLLFGIGGLIGLGQLDVWPTLIAAMIGAILGDGISFWLGYHFRERLATVWPFSRYPVLMKNGVRFFQKHGGKSVIFGRFVGPVRPIIPAVAGMMRMSVPKYLSINILSAMAWAPAYIIPTALLVGYTKEQASAVTQNLIISLLILLGLAWLIFSALRWLFRKKPVIATATIVVIATLIIFLLPGKQSAYFDASLETNKPHTEILESYGWRHSHEINHGGLLKWFDPNISSASLPLSTNPCNQGKEIWSHETVIPNYFVVLCIEDNGNTVKVSGQKIISLLSLMRIPVTDSDTELLEQQLEDIALSTGQEFIWQRGSSGRKLIIAE